MVCDDTEVELWLKRFSIRGAFVQDGEGRTVRLTRNRENQLCFEGGTLVLERRDALRRMGNSCTIISFRRCATTEAHCEITRRGTQDVAN